VVAGAGIVRGHAVAGTARTAPAASGILGWDSSRSISIVNRASHLWPHAMQRMQVLTVVFFGSTPLATISQIENC
jgi:hypothetical protein